MTLRISGVVPESMVDGPGVRYAVFVQGCLHGCAGCHNPETHPFDGGAERSVGDLAGEMRGPLIRGLTLSGGEPFHQARACFALAQKARSMGLDVWTYTGYTWDALFARGDEDELALLRASDVLIDGPYLRDQRSLTLRFRGSRNQRLIDVAASLKENGIILWE